MKTFQRFLKSIGNIIRSDDDGGGDGNRLEVPKGVWKIPFEFTIPKYAYESYNGKYVSIIYGIIFTADKAWGKDVKEKIPFSVFNLNTMLTDDNIKDWGTDISIEGEGIGKTIPKRQQEYFLCWRYYKGKANRRRF